ncbi:hypothetical protein B0I31_102406 [Saccharothrix carnea]|uniref:Uncharacterized protein n=1 Tax=Saccharothrix carnea TaxID=1280637 RepID=A0A2P8IG44_SACCR|nr:hypothetical protein B0I31_102406 [Saccharothrix carnea]
MAAGPPGDDNPAVTTARSLLKALDPLPYGARQRLLARTARELTGSAGLAELLGELDGRGEFERRLALHLAHAAGHREYVVRCLSATQTSVVRRAVGVAVRLDLPAEVFLARLPHLATALRQALYTAVRRHRRRALAERLLPVVREAFGDHEAVGLLPVCSSDVVAAALPDLEHAVVNWASLGRRHPAVLLDFVTAELDATPPVGWPQVWYRLGAVVALAAPAEPDRVLDLLARVLPHAPLPWQLDGVIGGLARHAPGRVARLLADPRRTGRLPERRSLWRAVSVTGDEDLIALARLLDGPRVSRLLHAIAPSRRAAVFTGVFGDRPDVPLAAVDELPSAARAVVARRLLSLRRVADDPARRLAVTARLDWADARDTLVAATRRATAGERAEAYPLYLAAAAATRDPEVVGGVVAGLTRLTNEQDPVRSVALAALAKVPSWLFRPAEADALTKLMVDATQARDCSWQTRDAVRALAEAVIREGAVSRHPELVDAGLAGVEHLGGNLPWINLHGLDRSLPRGAEHRVYEALRSRLVADARRGRFEVLLGLAAGLDRRAWGVAGVQELLDRARSAKDDGVVRRAVELWLAPPEHRDERVERVFAADPSTVTLPAVWRAISSRRTDLLDRVIGRSTHGRFQKRGVRFLPVFGLRPDRWLPRQVAAFAAELADLGTSPRANTYERTAAVRALGRLPGTVELVREFVGDDDLPVVEAALAALAWTDEPGDVLPDLLAHVDTHRARVAVYAVARCARFTSPERLGTLLTPLLEAPKVTARKEAVRLMAQHRVPGSVAVSTRAWENGHRDVRRALVSATRWFLDDKAAWNLLSRAVADERAVAGEVVQWPDAVPRRHRGRYAALVRALADSPDPDTARLGLDASPSWTRWSDGGTALLVRRVTDLADTATWRHALTAVVRLAAATEDVTPLREVVTALVAVDGGFDAEEDRDLPARQRIAALVRELADARDTDPSRAAAKALVGDLAAAGYRSWAVKLAVVAVEWEREGSELDGLRAVASLAVGPAVARQAADEVARVLPHVLPRVARPQLLDVVTALADDAAPLALAIVTTAGRDAGWSAPWRELLRGLRRHDDPDVREAALDVFTSQE